MKTIDELALGVAKDILHVRIDSKFGNPQYNSVEASWPALVQFAKRLIEAWQEQQSQEPVAWDNGVPLYTAPPPAKMPRFNCFALDNGCEQWFDCPDDVEILQELDIEHVGQEFELIAGWRSGRAKYRVTKAPDETSDDFEVECISHPEENVTPAQGGQS